MNDIRSIDAAALVGRADHAPGASPAAPASHPSSPRRGHGTFGLRAHLLALVLAALLPALVVGAAAVWQAALGHRAAFKARLADTARALALAVDSEIESHFAALHALAAAPQLNPETGDLAAFHDQARRVGDALGTWITVHGTGPGLPMLLNTNAGFGAPSTRPRPQAQFPAAPVPQVFETGRPAVGDLFVGRVSQRHFARVTVPLLRDGHVARAVSAALDPNRLARLLAAQNLREGSFAAVLDGRQAITARSDARDATFTGRRVPPGNAARYAASEAGVFLGPMLDGAEHLYAFQHLRNAPNWTVLVAEPAATYRASWQRPLLGLALGGAAALAWHSGSPSR